MTDTVARVETFLVARRRLTVRVETAVPGADAAAPSWRGPVWRDPDGSFVQ